MNIFLKYLYYYTIGLFISIIMNCLFWIKNYKRYNEYIRQKTYIINNIKHEQQISKYIQRFNWINESFFSWRPWIITILAQDFRLSCKGSSLLSKWMFSLTGQKSYNIGIFGIKSYLACINKTKTKLIYNNQIIDININCNDWKEYIKSFLSDELIKNIIFLI